MLCHEIDHDFLQGVECPSICKGMAEAPRDTNFAGTMVINRPRVTRRKSTTAEYCGACIAPSLNKEMAGRDRDGQIPFFFDVQQSATVCEQSATLLASRSPVQQFVNKVQQIATFTTLQDGSQATKNA